MEIIQQKFFEKYAHTQTDVIRDFIHEIDWNNRLIGIKGSRGIGKSTLLLQYIKKNFKPNNQILYASLDNFYFSENKLYHLADDFQKKGGQTLVLDEVHRYNDWSTEIKNIYDDFPNLQIIFTGSSMLHLQKAKADLSRRAVMYEMKGLSFREFIYFENKIKLPKYDIKDIITNHIEIAIDIVTKFKPLALFENYLNYGYYPYYLENKKSFHQKLTETVLTVLEVDIPQFEHIQTSNIIYLKRLLHIISNSVPFKPNMHVLSERTGISLNTMKTYLKYLSETNLILALEHPNKGINTLNKPEKIYLENPNLMYNLAGENANIGTIRETFFFNQTSKLNTVNPSASADFYINDLYTFEVGGKNKQQKQIANIDNSFVVKDNIEIGSENTIPLWLFGLLY